MSDERIPSCHDCKHHFEFTTGSGAFTRYYRDACRLTRHTIDEPENGNPSDYTSIKDERRSVYDWSCGREGKNFTKKTLRDMNEDEAFGTFILIFIVGAVVLTFIL